MIPKQVHQFTELKQWSGYVTTHMQNIHAQKRDESGIEIWLMVNRGVIGKWSEEINQGYIEEYRDFDRLRESHNQTRMSEHKEYLNNRSS
ncbi:MAG: hypothetical protein COA74_14710 [Gammaproteobacteria bacterium]|nr:MAG: hypothetical protein COA74_14710 [Gammaproteobacteria bacterium]